MKRKRIWLVAGLIVYFSSMFPSATHATTVIKPSLNKEIQSLADTIPPVGKITISGRGLTNSSTVSLNLSATDDSGKVTGMRFSNDNITYSVEEPFISSKSWKLSNSDGMKSVYAQFRDQAGNWSIPVSSSVTLDTTPPQVKITSPVDGILSGTPMLYFGGTIIEKNGVSAVIVSGAGTLFNFTGAIPQGQVNAYQWGQAFTNPRLPPGSVAHLAVQVIDGAGNYGGASIDALTPENVLPTVTITDPLKDYSIVPQAPLVVKGTADDASGIGSIAIDLYDHTIGSLIFAHRFATYDKAMHKWQLTIEPSYLTSGHQFGISVGAHDKFGNVSGAARRIYVEGYSRVRVSGTQLLVSKRLPAGNLGPELPFRMRGVNYSPVQVGGKINSYEDVRTILRNAYETGLMETDFSKLQVLGANTIRTYADFGSDKEAQAILDKAKAHNLMVLVTIRTLDIDPALVDVINAYKNHPAFLGFVIGNEWNINQDSEGYKPFFSGLYTTIAAAATGVNNTANQIHQLDPNHPVASSLGFIQNLGHVNLGPDIINKFANPTLDATTFSGVLSSLLNVDFWGFNVYRSRSFDPFFLEWNAFALDKPFFFSEFGTDDWTNETGKLDQLTQRDTILSLWDEIHRNLSANNNIHACVGGLIFEWNDEWWKAEFAQLGNPQTAIEDKNNFLQGTGGHPIKDIAHEIFKGHPDGFSNEEHYGLVNLNRAHKQIYDFLNNSGVFRLSWLQTSSMPYKVISQGGGASGEITFFKNNEPFYFRPGGSGGGRGFNVAVMDRSTGSVHTIRNFDSWTDNIGEPSKYNKVANACGEFLNLANSVVQNDVVMVGIGDSGVPENTSFCSGPTDQCCQALDKLGATKKNSISVRSSYALITVKKNPGPSVPLQENVDGLGTSVIATSNILLDADRDGILDNADLNNDQDAYSDVLEKSRAIMDPLTDWDILGGNP